jgi:hypothetical protein
MISLEEDLVGPACLRCGYCCRSAVCAFGAWDAAAHRCVHLTKGNECAIYKQIIALPRERWIGNPAFGAGCSSSLNSDRRRLAEQLAASARAQSGGGAG